MREHHTISVRPSAWAAMVDAAKAQNTSVSRMLDAFYGPPEPATTEQEPPERIVTAEPDWE